MIVVPVIVFVALHTGTLIWFLSRMNTTYQWLVVDIKSVKGALAQHDEAIDSIDRKMVAIETKCLARHGNGKSNG